MPALPGGVIEAFARAARAAGDGADAEEQAGLFLAWAAVTSRSWLVVLDDVADPGLVARWSPVSQSGTGWVLATTRRRDAAYLDRYRAGRERLEELLPASGDADGYERPVAVTLLLALDAAGGCDPAGLARPVITLAGLLDPAGHPAGFWAADAVTSYLASYRTAADLSPGQGHAPAELVTAGEARAALLVLHRYGLVSFDDHRCAARSCGVASRPVSCHARLWPAYRASRSVRPALMWASSPRAAA